MAAKKTVKVTGSAKATIDHDEIREWVESHGGHPAMVKSTARNGRGGILRIDFPGFSGERSLEEVSWDDFFDKFEESELAFLYQDQTGSGRPSRFNKLVSRASIAQSAEAGRAKPRAVRPSKKANKKTARRASAGRPATAKKRPAKRAAASGAGATRGRASTARKSARGAGARGASARGASARGAGARGTTKKKTRRQSKKRAQA